MNYIIPILTFIIGFLIKPFILPYLKQKGQNLATKQDIAEITKNEITEKTKRQLKYDACLGSLSSIDSKFSHLVWTNTSRQPTKQEVDIAKIRECHNKLILSCDNAEIVKKFIEIMFIDEKATPTVPLNEFRNLIRLELGFGSKLIFDEQKAWIGKVEGDTKE